VQFLNVIINWYSKCCACVRWNNILSGSYRLCGGVRQGGVLSCVLFFIYVNDIIISLRQQGLGCCIGDKFLGCLMYAYDLVLLSSSFYTLQLIISQCKLSCEALGLSLSVNKSAVVCVGPAYKHDCVEVKIGDVDMKYVRVIKYLEVHICTASKFKLNYDVVKASFLEH